MSDEQRRPRPAAQYGPTAATVADNVQRLRKRLDMSIYELSALLRKVGRPITPAAVGKIERQQRQVNVDDLTALAVALGVNPSALLFPVTLEPEHDVEVTGGGINRAEAVWAWADGHGPLRVKDAPSGTARGRELYEARLQFRQGRPHWLDEEDELDADEVDS